MGPKDSSPKESSINDSSDKVSKLNYPNHKKLNHKEFGDLGESLAEQYLLAKGFMVITRNYRTKIGEIDLIVKKENLVVFVEVKTRRTRSYGKGFEAVNFKKQQTLRRVADQFLAYGKDLSKMNVSMRFDVIDVFVQGNEPEINHIENAF